MSGRVIDLSRRETAAGERDRLTELLAQIEATRLARADWEKRDADLLSDADWHALDQLQELEGELVTRVLDPDLAAFLGCVLDQLVDIAEGRP